MRRNRSKYHRNQKQSPCGGSKLSFERLEDRAMLTIVFTPVYGPEAQIQNLNAVVPTPSVYLIFWGSYWLQGSGPTWQSQLATGAANVINCSFLQATAQCGTGG